MKTMKEVRHDNLLNLIAEAGSTSNLADKTGISVSYLLQIKNKNAIQNGKPKGIGDKIAAKLEDGMGKARGWLDQNHGEWQEITQNSPLALVEDEEEIVIDVLDHAASAGYGAYNGDMVEIVRQLRYVPEQFHQLFRGMNPEKIRVVSAKGDSMQPTIDHGDLLFLDISINYFDGDGIYVFNYGDYNYVKRLQKAGRTLRVISDNSELYAKWELEGEEADSIYIIGKVRAVQNQRLSFIG